MKKLIYTLSVTALSLTSFAQQEADVHLDPQYTSHCGFQQVLNKAGIDYGMLVKAYKGNSANKTTQTTDVIYDIPVVFHVIYNPARPEYNLHDSILLNQLEILNKAYRMQNSDVANVRSIFQPVAGDAHIQFHLATQDPNGNPTTGITRTESHRRYFGDNDPDSMENIKYTNRGGIDAWPTDRYINIWIGNLSNKQGQLGVMGYATPPLNPIPDNWPAGAEEDLKMLKDGVVLQTHCVGSNNDMNNVLLGIYTQGRVAVHEVGHYLGLQHVFGANDPSAPVCGSIADDGVDDTPEQSTVSREMSNTCPLDTKNSCGDGSAGDLPDMWENYMDYARDACQVMFTNGQIEIMRNVMSKQRASLTWPLSIKPTRDTPLSIYPNPASNTLSITLPYAANGMKIYNVVGQPVMTTGAVGSGSHTLDISALPAGNYVLMIESEKQPMTSRFSISK